MIVDGSWMRDENDMVGAGGGRHEISGGRGNLVYKKMS